METKRKEEKEAGGGGAGTKKPKVSETETKKLQERIEQQRKRVEEIEKMKKDVEKTLEDKGDELERERVILLFFEFMRASSCGKQVILNLSATPSDKWPYLLGLYIKEKSTRITDQSAVASILTDTVCDFFDRDLGADEFEKGLSSGFIRGLCVQQLDRGQTQSAFHVQRKEGRILVHSGNKNPVTCAEGLFFMNRGKVLLDFMLPNQEEGVNWIIVANKVK